MMMGVEGATAKPACSDSADKVGAGSDEKQIQTTATAGVVVVLVEDEEKCGGGGGGSCSKKARERTVECRICQEEGDVKSMESPCACSGTLKFAHRKCIQRWCNKKGDINCEICNQVFAPNYSTPPANISPDLVAIDVRRAWGTHINLRDSHLIALAAAERPLLQSEYEDYAVENSRSIACLRSVALVLLIILLLRQALMITRETGMVQESSTFFNFQVSVLQFAGFLLPCYIMARSWYIQSRRRQTWIVSVGAGILFHLERSHSLNVTSFFSGITQSRGASPQGQGLGTLPPTLTLPKRIQNAKSKSLKKKAKNGKIEKLKKWNRKEG